MKQLENSYPKTIFVNLDENLLIYPEKKIKKLLMLMPCLNDIKLKLKEIYKDFSKESRGFIYDVQHKEEILKEKNSAAATAKKKGKLNINTDNNPPRLQKCLIYNQNKIEDEKCKKIFEIICHYDSTIKVFFQALFVLF